MIVLAVDPGPEKSAFVIYDAAEAESECIKEFGILPNHSILTMLYLKENGIYPRYHLVIEMIASYGMPVGKDVFETCVWIGRFIQASGGECTKIYRKDVKLHLCGSARAKDTNIRQALIDRFGPPGTKKNPGPTRGISKDEWAALAVAVTFADTKLGS